MNQYQYQHLYKPHSALMEDRMIKIERMERKIAKKMETLEKLERIEKMEKNIEEKIEKQLEEEEERRKKSNKKISFDSTISAILIPSISDMDTETRANLWWDKIDYINFRCSSKIEIEMFLNIHKDLEYKDATRLLYQHSIICYEPYYQS